MAQQWYIQRQAKLGPVAGGKPKIARS